MRLSRLDRHSRACRSMRVGSSSSPSAATTYSTGLYLPGTSGNYVSTPDDASLNITGDLCLIIHLACDDWTPTSVNPLMSKWSSTASSCQYVFRTESTGKLGVYFRSGTGTIGHVTTTWTVNDEVADGESIWLACTYDDKTSMKFWHSSDGSSWSLIETVASTMTTAINTDTNDLRVGSYDETGTFMLAGSVYYAAVYSGIGDNSAPGLGTLVYEADFSHPWVNGLNTDSTGKVSTINGSAWAWEYA